METVSTIKPNLGEKPERSYNVAYHFVSGKTLSVRLSAESHKAAALTADVHITDGGFYSKEDATYYKIYREKIERIEVVEA